MSTSTGLVWSERIEPALPFLLMSALAIVGGGVLAAAMAHAPSRKLLWTVAYLVLVVGATQTALGAGQALLTTRAATAPARVAEWALFNLGRAGVIGGTLCSSRPVLWLGTLLFAASLAVFLWVTRGVGVAGHHRVSHVARTPRRQRRGRAGARHGQRQTLIPRACARPSQSCLARFQRC